jgi:2-dehydro-3-deoxygalactonokinase
MRGEETELLGLQYLLGNERLSGRLLVVLPGTHSKHVTIASERITGFKTYMTGELFHLLCHHGTLRLSLNSVEELSPEHLARPYLANAFRRGVEYSAREPLAAALFQIRASHLLHHRDPLSNLAFLSGLLIGSELSPLASGQQNAPQLILCAGAGVNFAYRLALESLGIGESAQVIPPAQVDCLAALGHTLLLNRILSSLELSPPHLGFDAAVPSLERVADVPLF